MQALTTDRSDGVQERWTVRRARERRPGRAVHRRPALLLAGAVLLASLVGAAIWVHLFTRTLLVDAFVYFGAGRVVLAHGDLYSASIPTPIPNFTLGFTYPPLAAELFALAGGFPIRVGAALLTAMSAAALFLICLLAIKGASRLTSARMFAYPIPLAVLATAWLAFTLEPVQQTFSFGQVNLVLAGLVAADCLIDRPWWPRGALVGLAAAIKLTPLAFILFFLAGRRYRAAVVSAGSFVVYGAIAWLIDPADSATFWFHDVAATQRIGSLWYAGNQSLRGMVARLGLEPTEQTIVWAGLALLVVVLGFLAARRRFGSDDPLGALVLIAAVALLVSPVSWSHHWVWVVPALIWGVGRAVQRRRQLLAVLVLAVAAIFVMGPQWLPPTGDDAELRWTFGEFVAGDAYVEIALLFVVVAGVVALLRRRTTGVPSGMEAAVVALETRVVGAPRTQAHLVVSPNSHNRVDADEVDRERVPV